MITTARAPSADPDAAALLPAKLVQCLSERSHQSRLRLRVIFGIADKHSDPAGLRSHTARAPGFSLRAQRGTGMPLAALGTPPLQHCLGVRRDARAHRGQTIE